MGSPEGTAPLDRFLLRLGATHGQLAWGAFAATVVSGIALAVLYDPVDPLASVEMIQGGLPLGWLIRAVHLLAGHALLILVLVHGADHVLGRGYARLGAADWWRVVMTLLLIVGGMFTGFLLRGDAEAVAAHTIARSVTRELPWLGGALSSFLWGAPHPPLRAPYVHHLVTFTLLPWLLATKHARGTWGGWTLSLATLATLVALALGIHPGPGLPAGGSEGELLGPWYLVGLQETFRWMPAWVAGLGLPALGLGVLGGLGHVRPFARPLRPRLETALRWSLLLGLVSYGLLSLAAWLHRGLG